MARKRVSSQFAKSIREDLQIFSPQTLAKIYDTTPNQIINWSTGKGFITDSTRRYIKNIQKDFTQIYKESDDPRFIQYWTKQISEAETKNPKGIRGIKLASTLRNIGRLLKEKIDEDLTKEERFEVNTELASNLRQMKFSKEEVTKFLVESSPKGRK